MRRILFYYSQNERIVIFASPKKYRLIHRRSLSTEMRYRIIITSERQTINNNNNSIIVIIIIIIITVIGNNIGECNNRNVPPYHLDFVLFCSLTAI